MSLRAKGQITITTVETDIYTVGFDRSVISVDCEQQRTGDDITSESDTYIYVKNNVTISNVARIIKDGEVQKIARGSYDVELSGQPYGTNAVAKGGVSILSDGLSMSLSFILVANKFRIDKDVVVRVTVVSEDGNEAVGTFTLIPNVHGQDGQDGDGSSVEVKNTSIAYAASSSGTVKPADSAFQSTVPNVPDGQYLWTRTRITFSNNTTADIYSVSRMGVDGQGIKSSTVDYSQQQTSNVNVETIEGWGRFPTNLIDGWWLYTRTRITYSNNETVTSYAVTQIGKGSYYAGVEEYYAIASSSVTPPSGYPYKSGQSYPLKYAKGEEVSVCGTWSQTRVYGNADAPYVWNFEVSSDSSGVRYVTEPICIGNFARGIVSIVETYAISSIGKPNRVNPPYPTDITSWTDEHQDAAPTTQRPYQWNHTQTTYTDGSVDHTYHVSAVKGDKGDGGLTGCIIRSLGLFDPKREYVNQSETVSDDLRYIDVVSYDGDLYMRTTLMSGYGANASGNYPSPGTDYWKKENKLEFVATNVLMATSAWIELLRGKSFYCTSDLDTDATNNPKIMTGMQSVSDNSTPTIFAGADNSHASSAAFRVYKNGRLVAQNAEIVGKVTSSEADISGKVVAKSGTIGGFNIGSYALTNSDNTASVEIYDGTQVTKIGASAKDAVTSQKCSMSAESKSTGTWNTALFLKAHGATYNYAFHGEGNGVLNGLVAGFRMSNIKLKSSGDEYIHTKLSDGSTIILSTAVKGASLRGAKLIYTPTLSDVRCSLGLSSSDSSTSFCIDVTYINRTTHDQCYLLFRGNDLAANDGMPYRLSNDNSYYDGGGARIRLQPGDIARLTIIYDTNDYVAFVRVSS